MRLVQFNHRRVGVVVGDQVVDISSLLPTHGTAPDSAMISLIEAWPSMKDDVTRAASGEGVPLSQVRLDAPLTRPGKIPSAPSNYRKHIAEMGSTLTIADRGIFLKANSSVIGPADTVKIPYLDRRTDHEAELGIIIGTEATRISESEALDHVFGYTCLLDVTVRGQEDRSMRKSFDTFTPIGPWIVTKDEIPDPDDLAVRCWVNGEIRQDGTTRDLVFSVPKLVSFMSGLMTLYPGDVIATGTPAGIGPITDSDTLSIEIEQIGRMDLPVSAEGAVLSPFGPDNWTQFQPTAQGAS